MAIFQESLNLATEIDKEYESFHVIKKRLKDQLYRLQVEERAIRTLLSCSTNTHVTDTFFSEVGESDASVGDQMETDQLNNHQINQKPLQDLTPLEIGKNNFDSSEGESVEENDD